MAQAQLPLKQQLNWEKYKSQAQLSAPGERQTTLPQLQPDWDDPECQKSLKLVLKWEIQNLLQRLAEAGEEALIMTANISDDSTNILGSYFGEKFVLQSDLALLKHQFLKYCRVHCKKKSKTSPTNKRKTSSENGAQKRQKKVLHHILHHRNSPTLDDTSPLGDPFSEYKEIEGQTEIESTAISTLATPIVPLSKANSSRRKHTPKRVVPALPVAQSESDNEDNSLSLNTIVKVEAADDQDDDLYGENQNHLDEYKTDLFDSYKNEDKSEYFDTFKSDDKNEFIDTLRSGNLSDDSSGGPYSSFFNVNEIQNSSGGGKDMVLTSAQKVKQSISKDCDSFRNGSLSGYTNIESDSDISIIEGLSGDTSSLPDMDPFSYPVNLTSVPSVYMDQQRNMKMQLKTPDVSKKGSSRASNASKSSGNEDPAETALLDQSKRGVRKYQCPCCELMVRDRHDLKRHLRTHTKEKPYSCDICDKKFSRKWDQENHVKKHLEMKYREEMLAKEAELQVKQNLDTISKLTMKVQLQKMGLDKHDQKGFMFNEDSGSTDRSVVDNSLGSLREVVNGSLECSPVKQEYNST